MFITMPTSGVPASCVEVISNPARKVEHLHVAKLLAASFHFTRVARTVGWTALLHTPQETSVHPSGAGDCPSQAYCDSREEEEKRGAPVRAWNQHNRLLRTITNVP